MKLRTLAILLSLLLFLNIGDILTTYYCLTIGGEETNPMMVYLFSTIGFVSNSMIKILLIGLLSLLFGIMEYWEKKSKLEKRIVNCFMWTTLIMLNLFYALVLTNNLYWVLKATGLS